MNRLLRCSAILLATSAVIGLHVATVRAVSPIEQRQGQLLFKKDWKSSNPALGGDGLGPLFNATSCVACHNQGGVGGGGDNRFNAVSVGIDAIEIHLFDSGRVPREKIAEHLRKFYPGLVRADGTIISSAPAPHHGGSSAFHGIRDEVWSRVSALQSAEGGPSNASEARVLSEDPIVTVTETKRYRIVTRARLFQRNTTSLFGAGLIDSIPGEALEAEAERQKRDREVSGRMAILQDGTVGRFGWRGNVNRLVNFVDRACANEIGLETERQVQGTDPTQMGYRNTDVDIADPQIELISAFIAGLKAPLRANPNDQQELFQVQRGESLFASVGCASCHVPQLGQVEGLYSDLLLHDMGKRLYDLEMAEPYVVSQNLEKTLTPVVDPRSQFVGYYGTISSIDDFTIGTLSRSNSTASFVMKSPRSSVVSSDFVPFMRGREILTDVFNDRSLNATSKRSGRQMREEFGLRRRLQPSNVSQEWRTPPLWGCRDSAPYMHDGRAATLLEAIVVHEGESEGSRDRFLNLSLSDRNALLAFLDTLIAPRTDGVAIN